jgi:hypothetical protein
MRKEWGGPVFLLLVFLLPIACGLLPAPLRGASWEDEKDEWEKFSSTRFYKDPGYAAKLALNFLPVDNGHFYVGEVGKGIWFSVGQTVALAAVAVPVLNSQSRTRQDKDPVWTSGMVATAGGGALVYLALKVWSAYDAADGARRYNAEQEKLRQQQGFRFGIHPRGVVLTRRFE